MTAKSIKSVAIQELSQQEKENQGKLGHAPQGVAIGAVMQVLGAQDDFSDMTLRLNNHPTAHGRTVTYDEHGQSFEMTFTRGDNVIKIMADMKALSGYNSSVRKIFVRILEKMNEQSGTNGELKDNHISFHLQDLVKLGIYKDVHSSRRGYIASETPLMSLKVSGTIKKGKKEVGQDAVSIFPRMNVYNGVCNVYINECLNMEFFAPSYMPLPNFYYSLPAKGADLLFLVHWHAKIRQNDIKSKGYVNIGLRSVANFLGLPDETKTKNPTSAIKKPIEDAITAIENKLLAIGKKGEIKLTVYSDPGVSITNYLDNGYIRASMSGDYAKEFIAAADKKAKAISAAIKRKQKREDEARIKYLVQKMETEDKKKEDSRKKK